jgi:hypothetical protein
MLKFKQFVEKVLESSEYSINEAGSSDAIQFAIDDVLKTISDENKKEMEVLSTDYIKSCGYDIDSLMDLDNASNVLTISSTVTKLRINGYSYKSLTFDFPLNKAKEISRSLQNKIEKKIVKLTKAEISLCLIYLCLSKNPQFVQFGTKNTLSVEEFQIEDINRKIKEAKSKNGMLRIKIDGRFVKEGNGPLIVEAISANKSESKVGKSDVDLVIEIEGKYNKIIYISLKDRKPGDGPGQGFRQFGGLKGKSEYPSVINFSEVLKQKLGRNYLNNATSDPGKSSFAVPIPESDMDLALKSIFGLNAGTGNQNFSSENLHMVVEGELIFEEDGEGFFHIKPGKNSEIIYNPVIGIEGSPVINSESPYWPCIYVGYSKEESLGGSIGWKHARFGFWTLNNKATRTAIKNAENLGITTDSIR